MWKRLVAALLIGAATALVTRWWREYPWPLAGLSGASLGALVFASLQTMVRLRATLAQYGPRPVSPDAETEEGAAAPENSPASRNASVPPSIEE